MFRAIFVAMLLFTSIFALTGCGSAGVMPLEANFKSVVVGQSTSVQLLDKLSDQKLLQTADKISVLNNKGSFDREVAIASIEPDSSLISRYVYMSRSKNLTDVKLRLIVSTKVSPQVLLMPYASENDKNLAIIRYCHQVLREDAMAFSNDNESYDLMNQASQVLSIGIVKMQAAPRDISDINTENGFTYDDMTAGQCKIRLKQSNDSDIYTLTIHTRDAFDWLVPW